MYTILMFGIAQAVLIRGLSVFLGDPYRRHLNLMPCSKIQMYTVREI